MYFDSVGYSKEKVSPYPSDVSDVQIYGFTIITKPKPNREEVYEGILLPYWQQKLNNKAGFFVATWGRPYLESICSVAGMVNNIYEMEIDGHDYKNTQDHAKWAVHYDF